MDVKSILSVKSRTLNNSISEVSLVYSDSNTFLLWHSSFFQIAAQDQDAALRQPVSLEAAALGCAAEAGEEAAVELEPATLLQSQSHPASEPTAAHPHLVPRIAFHEVLSERRTPNQFIKSLNGRRGEVLYLKSHISLKKKKKIPNFFELLFSLVIVKNLKRKPKWVFYLILCQS